MLPGTEKAIATFDLENADSFLSETAVWKSEFSYEKIGLVAEIYEDFVFLFSSSHAQIYDEHSLFGGTCDGFREFMQTVTKKAVIPVK